MINTLYDCLSMCASKVKEKLINTL